MLPMSPDLPPHVRFRSDAGEHLFVTRYSRLFDLSGPDAMRFDAGDEAASFLDALGQRTDGDEALGVPPPPAPQSISLNIASRCNLACSYCYAAQGGFEGRQQAQMDWEIAKAAIDSLLDGADPKRPITIGFMGGEPLVSRKLITKSVDYAAQRGAREALDIRFSITTNGTLIEASDIDLFRDHGFAVTVSLDGTREDQDRQRPLAGGQGSWARIASRIAPFLAEPGAAHIAARATVTGNSQSVTTIFDSIVGLGFPEVGLSPLRATDAPGVTIDDKGWEQYGSELIALAQRELATLRAGGILRLTNFAVALKQIHRGACSPYPCGAGGGYFSVGSDGDWYACHRAIGKDDFRMGSSAGLDLARRSAFLDARHVDAQTDCTSCWARYLCSGGCHHEAAARSAASCDFIRRWLNFCLTSYCELNELHRLLSEKEDVIHA